MVVVVLFALAVEFISNYNLGVWSVGVCVSVCRMSVIFVQSFSYKNWLCKDNCAAIRAENKINFSVGKVSVKFKNLPMLVNGKLLHKVANSGSQIKLYILKHSQHIEIKNVPDLRPFRVTLGEIIIIKI